MIASDKLIRDLQEWARQSGHAPDTRAFEALRTRFALAVGNLPQSTANEVFTNFLARYNADPDAALDWLGGFGSLLLQEYNGHPFSQPEWTEIRDLISSDPGHIDLEVLTYVLNMVMEHGAL